jgi:hypothetical protein
MLNKTIHTDRDNATYRARNLQPKRRVRGSDTEYVLNSSKEPTMSLLSTRIQ